MVQEAVDNGKPDNIAFAAPRGMAKSTIVSFALPIWCAVYKKKHYIIIVSDTSGQADDFLSNIRNELEDNEMLIEDFGLQEGAVWTTSNIILKNGVRIQSLGAGKKIRGRRHKQYRPDLIIGDDLENDENISSPDQRHKMESWHSKALSKAGDERTDKIFIGTIIHYDSLLSKLLKNPAYYSQKYQAVIKWSDSNLWDEWERIVTNLEDDKRLERARAFFKHNKWEMLKGTKVIWPQKEDYYNLMLQRVADGPAAFSSEKQNEPLSDDERRFLPEWIQYYDDDEIKGRELYIAGACDPSLGKAGGDFSAIITGGKDANEIIYILDADILKRHPDNIISDVIVKHEKYNYQQFGVETNQFQQYFRDNFFTKIAQYNEEKKKNIQIPIRDIKNLSDKVLRIQSLQPDIKNGRVKFRRDQQKLIEQLVNFPSADHDDGPDALEMLVRILGKTSAVAAYLKEQAKENETGKINPKSFLQNPDISRFIK